MHHGTRRPRRSGFSVLELTIAIAILGVMMAVAGFAFVPMILGARVKATEATMKTVDSSIKNYFAAKGSFPPNLQALVPQYMETTPLDGWDNEFFYSPTGPTPNSYILISWGADGDDGTPDDIDFEDVKHKRNRDN